MQSKTDTLFQTNILNIDKNTKSEKKFLIYINRQRNCSYWHIIISCLFFIFFQIDLIFVIY